jgi:predicted dehydrogenase
MQHPRRIDRRRFLKRGGVALATLCAPVILPASARGADGQLPPSERITLGIVGFGAMGEGNTKSFLNEKSCRVVAVCDVDEERRRNGKSLIDAGYGDKGCAEYERFEELLARDDIDAVVSCVPDHWHALLGIAAAGAGKDVYGEKPLAHDIREGRALCEAVRRHGRIWQTGCWQRSTWNFQHVARLVHNGYIGDSIEVEVGLPNGLGVANGGDPTLYDPAAPPAQLDYDRWLGPAPWEPYCPGRVHWNWRWTLATGGGQLMDWIGHHFDIAQWALGLDHTGPAEVEATGKLLVHPVFNVPVDYHVTATYANGQVIKIGAAGKYYPMGVTFRGSEGWIYVNRGETKLSDPRLLKIWFRANDKPLGGGMNHHLGFLEGVRQRTPTVAPAEPAHRAASVGYLGLVSILLGRKLRWDPDREVVLGDDEANRMLGRPMRAPWRL